MLQNVIELCQALVRVPSVNPHGDPGVENPGERACAEFVADFLRGCGAETSLHEVRPGRPNVVGRFPADRPGKPRLIFAPHLDTVSVGGMTIDPFAAELRDGKIWGRGASDTKGPMSAMLWALREMRDAIPALPHEIWFAGLMGEEAGQDGARAFVRELVNEPGFDPARCFALVGEPTMLDVVHRTKGATWIKASAHGKAVHASTPDKGDNAIYKMASLVSAVRDEVAPSLKKLSDPLLGSPTISVGVIRGGTKTNIVPDLCEVEIDLRSIPGQDISLVLDLLRNACPGVTLELSQSSPPLDTDAAHPLIALLASDGSRPVGAPWFCDAAVFSAAKIPAVACGPGDIAQAHTCDEWIAVIELERGAAFYRRFLARLA
jgi:acetylornithine deacetylase/succinyl-diaminopimelate desuccinylase-like protein